MGFNSTWIGSTIRYFAHVWHERRAIHALENAVRIRRPVQLKPHAFGSGDSGHVSLVRPVVDELRAVSPLEVFRVARSVGTLQDDELLHVHPEARGQAWRSEEGFRLIFYWFVWCFYT